MPRSVRARLLLATASLGMSIGVPAISFGQDAPASSPAPATDATVDDNPLDTILATLEANLTNYNRSVPSFLCNEHVISEAENAPIANRQRTITDSTFRVRRTIIEDRFHLVESRLVRTVDGKPPAAAPDDEVSLLDGPMAVFGVFTGGLELISPNNKSCFRYRLREPRKGHPADKIEIDFQDLPGRERDPKCPYTAKNSGKAYINPTTMRVVRLEAKMREYEVRPGEKETWQWAIDYAPVLLGGKTFWMPSAIHSKAIPDTVSNDLSTSPTPGRRGGSTTMASAHETPTTFTLEAKYTDYHLLNVSSRIIAITDDDPPTPPEVPAPDAPTAPAPDAHALPES